MMMRKAAEHLYQEHHSQLKKDPETQTIIEVFGFSFSTQPTVRYDVRVFRQVEATTVLLI